MFGMEHSKTGLGILAPNATFKRKLGFNDFKVVVD